MRIISGTSRGRRLVAQRGRAIRPTSDRIKESIFNILGNEVQGKLIVDLFAGTGSLGIEALSRGAKKVLFVEIERQALRIIQKNLSACGMQRHAEVVPRDVNRAIGMLHGRGESFDLILMDPPYRQGLIRATVEKLESRPIHHEDSILVIQHDRREPLPDLTGAWDLIRQRRIGDSLITFLTPGALEPQVAADP